MNVAVTAKGGVGKTVLAGTLARAFGANGHEVLAIDHDADPNLSVSLGLPRERDVAPVPSDLVERVETDDGETEWDITRPAAEVVDDYGVRADDGVVLLKARTVEADSGDFVLGHVAVTSILEARAGDGEIEARAGDGEIESGGVGMIEGGGDDTGEDVVVVDMPAGLEYFGIINHVDVMLVVVEHASTALDTLRTMDLYARKEIGMTDVRVVANAVRSERDLAAIREFCEEHDTDLEIAAVVPHDEAIRRAEREGVAPIDYDPESPGVVAIRELAADLESSFDR